MTITTQAGTDVTLEMASRTRVSANGALATLATLKALIGSEVTVAYSQQTKIASDLKAQAKAEQSATVTGVIKAVNPAEGTVTIATSTGQEVILNVTVAMATSLAANIGAQVTAQYNAQTKTATSISAQTQASAFASFSGTLKAVDVLSNTITVTGHAGAEVVLNIGAQSQVLLNGSAAALVALAASLGSQVTVEYNLHTKVANSVRVLVGGETTTPPPSPTATSEVATVSGTLKSVNTLADAVTIATSSGQEVILNVTVAMATSLAANIGAQVTAQYNVQTNTAMSIGVQ